MGAMTHVITRSAQVSWWIGLAGHLVMLAWFAASTVLAPTWAVAGLLVAWLMLLVTGLRLRTTRPVWMLAIPVLDVAIWVGVLSAGEALLGWTA